jgi:esterase/lipase
MAILNKPINAVVDEMACDKALSKQCLQLSAHEESLFNQDYEYHAIVGESKDKTIGKPFLLHHPKHTKGILLIHGLMAAPFEVKLWADALFAQGYNVYAPRLSGHGTSVFDLATRNKLEWIQAAERGYNILAECSDEVIVAGFSTGAALALDLVIKYPNKFSAAICISAPLKLKKFTAHFASPVHYWNKIMALLKFNMARKEFVTNHADNPHINYLRCPVVSIVQIKRLMKGVRRDLAKIKLPMLVMHATHDPKVDVQSSKEIYKCIGSTNKTYYEIDFDQHGIINGDIAKTVFRQVEDFLQTVTPVKAT